jgi:hypothetical protein
MIFRITAIGDHQRVHDPVIVHAEVHVIAIGFSFGSLSEPEKLVDKDSICD